MLTAVVGDVTVITGAAYGVGTAGAAAGRTGAGC